DRLDRERIREPGRRRGRRALRRDLVEADSRLLRQRVQREDHVGRRELARHRLGEAEDARGAYGRQRLLERARAVGGDLGLHGSRLLLQAGRRRALRRDQGEVADAEDEDEDGRHDRNLSPLRQAGEAGGHEAPLPLRMSETMVNWMTFWPASCAVWLCWSWTFFRSGTTESRSRSRAT